MATGADRYRDDPSVVFVWANADEPGGKFFAIRVGGVWRVTSLTMGELNDEGFKSIEDSSEVEALLKAARTSPEKTDASPEPSQTSLPKSDDWYRQAILLGSRMASSEARRMLAMKAQQYYSNRRQNNPAPPED